MVNPNVQYDPTQTLAIPCGIAARSFFNDNYVLFRCDLTNP